MWFNAFYVLLAAILATLEIWRFRRLREARARAGAAERRLEHCQQELASQAARALSQQQALFNSMTEGVLLLDGEGRIQLANRALQQIVGYSGSIVGLTALEAFRRHELMDLVRQALAERQVQGFEFDLAGAQPRSLQINAAAILDGETKAPVVILVFHDVTRLKQLENTRKEFVANVSHELRTPLSIIKGYAETLLDGAKADPAALTRFLQTILKHSDRLTLLIEDLLTLSRLESGKTALNLQPAPALPLIQRVFDDLASRAAAKQVTLEHALTSGIAVKADPDQIERVLFNLVDNAIKYGRNGGRVIVRSSERAENKVEISVADDGPGIPAEARERVFERFYRVDRARSRDQGGTGLGLAIVKHIVQTHGGEVKVCSELGRGSVFSFTLDRGG